LDSVLSVVTTSVATSEPRLLLLIPIDFIAFSTATVILSLLNVSVDPLRFNTYETVTEGSIELASSISTSFLFSYFGTKLMPSKYEGYRIIKWGFNIVFEST
jgi:hypothetical protein